MNSRAPLFERFCCIGDDPILVAEISSLFNKASHYFSVINAPVLRDLDTDNDVIRVTNALSIMQPDIVIYAGLTEKVKQKFSSRIPLKKILEVNNIDEIDVKLKSRTKNNQDMLHWGRDHLGLGLFWAKHSSKRLRIDMEESPLSDILDMERDVLVVYEEQNIISDIIAANYAYSIGAWLRPIKPTSQELISDIHEEFYSIYSEGNNKSVSESIKVLRERLRNLSGEINFRGVKCATFFTSGLPWGYAFNEVPSTHIFTNQNIIGVYLVSAIASEKQGIKVCLLIDPGKFEHAEIKMIRELLVKRNVFVRVLEDKTATCHNVDLNIVLYPYDLLIISTHAGDVEGMRVTYKFTDSCGNDREFVIDEGVGFAFKPKSDKIKVTNFMRFVSLDGVLWSDSKGKKQINAGYALQDFINFRTSDEKRIRTIKKEETNRVQNSMALKMSDGNLLIMLHSIGYRTSPIIFNNACCTWHELAARFIFAGARSYIGTMFPVTDVEATEIANSLFKNHLDKPLAMAIWCAQNDIYGDDKRHPYVMVGLHFSRMSFSKKDVPKYIAYYLLESLMAWKIKSVDESKDSEVRRNAKEYKEFLEEELKKHMSHWSPHMANTQELLEQSKLYIKALKMSLIHRTDPAQVSLIAKIPYKALNLKEALLYRATDLSDASCILIDEENFVSAACTTLAFQETLATLYYINGKIKHAISSEDVSQLDETLMKILMGLKNNPDLPDPIDIPIILDLLHREIPIFRVAYDGLSELSHPYWAGTAGIYTKINKEKLWTNFGKNISLKADTRGQIVFALHSGLELLVHIYDELAEFLPKLIIICEKAVELKDVT
jgi:hypothetical protein